MTLQGLTVHLLGKPSSSTKGPLWPQEAMFDHNYRPLAFQVPSGEYGSICRTTGHDLIARLVYLLRNLLMVVPLPSGQLSVSSPGYLYLESQVAQRNRPKRCPKAAQS